MERMKSFMWFVVGIAGGFVAAHLVNKDPRGHEVLAEVDARIGEFTDRIGEAYRAQESKIDGLVADVKDAAAQALATADPSYAAETADDLVVTASATTAKTAD